MFALHMDAASRASKPKAWCRPVLERGKSGVVGETEVLQVLQACHEMLMPSILGNEC